ncbi:hypothetical protein CHU98_g11140 [Xylaria longipes]|nr:hypothetical protein CHU98_g11140 [Xylaria longipes]
MSRVNSLWLLSLGALVVLISAVYLAPLSNLTTLMVDVTLSILASSPTAYHSINNVTCVGTRKPGVDHFLNIFYGEDTAGPNRENCLSLRISRGRDIKADANLPVAVWLHGGGHALGSAYEVLYEPDGIVRQATLDGQPLIFVAINYRLGLTAISQSVGASDLALHLTSFKGERGVPFQQAIMMSGAGGQNFNTLSDVVANNTAAIADKVGCVIAGDSQSLRTLQCLREAPVDVLTNLSVTASWAARPPFGEAFFFPTYDGDIVPG